MDNVWFRFRCDFHLGHCVLAKRAAKITKIFLIIRGKLVVIRVLTCKECRDSYNVFRKMCIFAAEIQSR